MAKAKKNKELNILPFVQIFDTALAREDSREFKARNYLYASEISMSFYDRYLSMKGVPPSNLPNEIAIRKFKLGNMIEDFFRIVLYQVGLLRSHEERVMSNFDFGLQVSGRLDVLYGGKFDFKAIDNFEKEYHFLSFIGVLSGAIREFAERNKNVVYDIAGIEIKSMSDIMFNRIDARGTAEVHHLLQTFHYAYWKQMPFLLIYFDKNNARVKEFWVMPDDKELYKMYCADILKMTEYYNTNTEPPKEKLLTFDGNRFGNNWAIQYSKYLTHSYGFGTKQQYLDYATPIVGRWNRVLARIKDGKELTKDNMVAIDEMRRAGYDIGLPETIDVQHEDITEQTVHTKETSSDKLLKLKKILS